MHRFINNSHTFSSNPSYSRSTFHAVKFKRNVPTHCQFASAANRYSSKSKATANTFLKVSAKLSNMTSSVLYAPCRSHPARSYKRTNNYIARICISVTNTVANILTLSNCARCTSTCSMNMSIISVM